jgi:hypothetical protein
MLTKAAQLMCFLTGADSLILWGWFAQFALPGIR